MIWKLPTAIFLGLVCCTACTSPNNNNLIDNNLIESAATPVVLDAAEVSTFTASNQREYRFQIRYPNSYTTKPEKKYPVILKMDGQWDFPLAASVVNNIYFDGQMPEALVIGLDWVDTSPNIQAVRMRDLSPIAYRLLPLMA